MKWSSPQEISLLLQAWRAGDEAALDQLMPLVYGELHRLAHRFMVNEREEHTLQTTALVNEAYLRLVDVNRVDWQDRAHFFAICAQLMRRILVDFARSRGYQKRGGAVRKELLDEVQIVSPEPEVDLVRLDDALNTLAGFDSRKAKVVELRFFGGLSEEEAAEVLKVSRNTVKRDWRLAKVWLLEELSDEG
ncbi:MAG: sigma-70 family RNA polymerase sigma factor [Acidobacteriia bacterium]|nr:sigma-70 family RNA polymerase sigma factor [Terriglobia bacterium]